MADQARLNQLESTVTQAISSLVQIIDSRTTEAVDQILDSISGGFASRTTVFAALQNTTPTVVEIAAAIESAVEDYVSLFAEEGFDSAEPPNTQELVAVIEAELAQESRSFAAELAAIVVLASITSQPVTNPRRDVRSRRSAYLRRIAVIASNSTQNMISGVAALAGTAAGVKRYRYSGGTISSSRPFCIKHNGKTYTGAQMQQIWRGTWAGKSGSNPQVNRGGYNCRHFWVPVRDE